MSNVKVIEKGLTRFTLIRAAVNGPAGMLEDERGDWVRYEDVQRARKQAIRDCIAVVQQASVIYPDNQLNRFVNQGDVIAALNRLLDAS